MAETCRKSSPIHFSPKAGMRARTPSAVFILSICISTRIKEEKTRRCAGPGRASLSSALRARAALSEDPLIRLSSSHKEDY